MDFNFKTIYISLFLLIVSLPLEGQQASYRILGEELLWGVDIYSLLEDDHGHIWLSTDNGLFCYNGYEFKNYHNQELRSKSLFCLTKDQENRIYCANLSGQIMRWEKDSLQLFHQLPDSLMGVSINLQSNEKNELIVSAKKPFKLDSLGNLSFIPMPSEDFQPIHLIYSSKLRQYLGYGANHHAYIFNEQINMGFDNSHLEKTIYGQSPDFFYFLAKNQLRQFKPEINHSKGGDLDLLTQLDVDDNYNSNNIYRLFFKSDGSIWLGDHNKGIHAFQSNGQRLFPKSRIFEDFFISAFLEDQAGNIWLGTMDKGLIFIPQTAFWHYDFDFTVSQITADPQGNIFLGTDEGAIYCYDKNGHLEKWHQISSGPIRNLYFDSIQNRLLSSELNLLFEIDTDNRQLKEYQSSVSAIKDYTYGANAELWFCDERHIFKLNYPELETLNKHSRYYSLYYDSSTLSFLAGTHQGLIRHQRDSNQPLLYNGQKIMVTDIVGAAHRIYLSTTQYGLLYLKEGQIYQALAPSELLSERISQLQVYQNYLGIASRKGFQLYDLEKDKLYSLTAQDGLLNNNILDFEIVQDQLYLVTNAGLQKLPISILLETAAKPQLCITDWRVNTSIRSSQDSILNYHENQLEWRLQLQTAQHRGFSRFAYRLEGLNEDWQSVSDASPLIRYSALGPGSYRLLAKVIDGEGNASVVQSFSFVVLAPFWQKSWFIISIILLVLVNIFLIFRWQIQRIQQKNREQQELIRSKLTALKSQMNPHFIFNSLNSIQDLILKEDIDNSYDYIVKFSNMMRTTLNYSEKDFVGLDEEIKLLSLYLDLEQLRFGKDFDYKIVNKIEEELDIPPMLIQPFVENAIKHGLLHKKGPKKLELIFQFKDQQILAKVIDNGIGRQKSAEIKKNYHNQHQSFSTQALDRRFEVLSKHYEQILGFEYVDLVEDGQSQGTAVIIRLPYIRRI